MLVIILVLSVLVVVATTYYQMSFNDKQFLSYYVRMVNLRKSESVRN